MHIIRFKNMDEYFADLREAYKWSLLAADSYEEANEQEKLIIRQSLSVAGDEVTGYLSTRIRQRHLLIYNRLLIKDQQLNFRTEVYNRIMEGDALIALQKLFVNVETLLMIPRI